MNQPGFQPAGGCLAPLPSPEDQASLLPTGAPMSGTTWDSQNASNVLRQAVPPFNPEPYCGLMRHWYTGYAEFGRSPDADLPLNSMDQTIQPNLLSWAQPKVAAKLKSLPIPYGDINCNTLSGFEQAITAGDAPVTQRLGKSYSNPQHRRCVRCWALKRQVILFI